MPHPFTEFFLLLNQAGFCITLRDYYRLQQVLSTQGEWTIQRLERILIALFANSDQQIQSVQKAFRDSFTTPQGDSYEAVLDIAKCRKQILALIDKLPVSHHSQPLHQAVPLIPLEKKTPQVPAKSNKYWQVALVVLLLLFSPPWIDQKSKQDSEKTTPVEPTIINPQVDAKVTTVTIESIKNNQINTPATTLQESNTQTLIWQWLGLFFSALSMGLFAYAYWRNRPLKARAFKSKIDVVIKKDFFDDSLLGGKPQQWLSASQIEQISEQLQYIKTTCYSNELAVEQSIHDSIKAGSSQLCFQPYKTIQPILILISLSPQFSRWHTMAEELEQGLKARGVKVILAYCQQSFQRFVDKKRVEYDLEQWQDEHPKARLFIFLDSQTNQAIQVFNAKRWAQLQVFTIRDNLQWDYREGQLLVQGIPLQEATARHLVQFRRDKHLQSYEIPHLQSFELQRKQESNAQYLKRVLGEALPLAQALSLYPRAWSLSAADSLRCQYFPQLSRLSLQRCMRLSLHAKGNSYRFARRWQIQLLADFQHTDAVYQQSIKKHWLALLNACEPKHKNSNAWAGWRWRKSLLLWDDDPDKQIETIAALVAKFPDFDNAIKQQSTVLFKQGNEDSHDNQSRNHTQSAKKYPSKRHAKRV
jgi:hypothetical protein